MNTPNKLTVMRMILVPFMVLFLLTGWGGEANRYICLVIFAVASITDWFDGYLARKYDLTDGAKVNWYHPVALAPACSLDDDVSVAPLLHYCAAWPFNCQNFLWYYHIVSIGCYIVANPIQR